MLYDASAGIGVDVAIIDSGVNGKHCEFTGRVKRIFDFVNEAGIDDPIGHGMEHLLFFFFFFYNFIIIIIPL